jgi:hypothetical protein
MMNEPVLAKGTLVSVTSSGPLYGRKGIIRSIDIIGAETPFPVVFYLVSWQDEPGKEAWFDHDSVAAVVGNVASLPHSTHGNQGVPC